MLFEIFKKGFSEILYDENEEINKLIKRGCGRKHVPTVNLRNNYVEYVCVCVCILC